MLSRVADSIYWLNRYIERAENVARFIDVNINLMLDLPTRTQQWKPLIYTTGDLTIFQERYGEINGENVIHFLTFDQEYSNSILSCLQMARENARSIREIISSEMWEEVNEFYLMVKDAAGKPNIKANLPEFFNQVKMSSHRFAGVMDATMTHNEGWHFGQVGRLLERADKTTRILDVKYFLLLPSVEWVGTALDQIQWIALLKSASAYEMYRKCQHRIIPNSVAEFLILNRQFPRSIHCCLWLAQQYLHQITSTPKGSWTNNTERALGRLCSELGYLTIDEIMVHGLHEFLDEMQRKMNDVGHQISLTFFGQETVEMSQSQN
jgi:uncharacterized alpha-E superfamily protein